MMARTSLQTRLLLGFTILLVVLLLVVGVAFIAFVQSRPVPLESLLNELAAVSVETDFQAYLTQQRGQGNRPLLNLNDPDQLRELQLFLDDVAQQSMFRLLLVWGDGQVVYDSQGGQLEGLQIGSVSERPFISRLTAGNRAALFYTSQRDLDGQEWVLMTRRLAGRNDNANNLHYVVMSPRPHPSLTRTLENFSDTFFVPLLQAGLIGFGVALLLSIGLARSIARPLQTLSGAANKVAKGDYEQRVRVQGVLEAQILAQAFNDMTEQVQLTQQAQQDFLANVTHDLRTPLTSIQGFSQAIMDGVAADPASACHAAEVIHDEASRLNRMVSELLDLAKVQAGRLQMTRQTVELERVLRRVGDSMSIKAQQKGVHFETQIAELLHIAGDGDRLAQVFTNLVDNAIKHTDSGGRVWLRAKAQADGVLIQVQDTGEGIPADDLSRIFERFYQVDKSRNRQAQHQGAGLGLAITAEIIKAHGGKIWAESQVGMGSRFNILLPMLRADQSTLISRRM
jgi:signal transduction histidine kinase